MLNALSELLADDAKVLFRYLKLAVGYGLLSGLTIATLVPALTCLLNGDMRGSGLWLGGLLGGVLLCWMLRLKVERAGVAVGVAVLRSARQRIGDHVARLPIGWFDAEQTARLAHVIGPGMMAVAQLPAHVFTPLISSALTSLVMLLMLLWVHGPLGLVALLGLPVLLSTMWLMSRLGRRVDAAFQHDFAAASQRIVEFAQAQSVLRAFNGEGGGTRLLDQAIDRQRQSARRLIVRSSLSALLNAWVVHVLFACLLGVAALWLSDALGAGADYTTLVTLVVGLVLLCRFVDPLLEVASYADIVRAGQAQLEAAQAILAVAPLTQPHTPQQPADGSVELHDVSFAYAADQPNVLQGISLRIKAGSMVALIGASGSGKTTLVRLIARFFDVSQGSLLVGGVDVRQIASERLAGQISQIFQDSYLFQGSIADNIRIGKPSASTEQVLLAAQQAGVSEVVARLPDGLDSQVGEGGARLSGGERQRIAIARALLKDAPILLVDEATAALDADNQAAIAQTLQRLRGRCTLIVIAHQLSTVATADQIVVLENGRVVEQGAPVALLGCGGRYAGFIRQRQAAQGWRITAATQRGPV